jgi:hypothetical protein
MRPVLNACAAAFTLALSAVAWQAASPPVSFEIRGKVLEPGTDQPVAGAEVTVQTRPGGNGPRINGGWQAASGPKAIADASGAFRLALEKPGDYRVEAKLEGFSIAETGSARNYAEITLSKEKPSAEARLYLSRPGRISGTVVDDLTRKPVAGVRVHAILKRVPFGFLPGAGPQATTGADGRFTVTDLAPGEYAIEVGPQADGAKRVRATFTEKEAEATPEDYEDTFWPGGHGPEAALPVTIASGAALDIGALPVKQVPYYNVRVRIPISRCQAGDKIGVGESIIDGGRMSIHGLASVPCSKEILVAGFKAGSYRLTLDIASEDAGNDGSASVPFSIRDENISITAPLLPSVTVDGAIALAEGAKPPDYAKIKVGLNAVDRRATRLTGPVAPEPDGKFSLEGIRQLDHTISISGIAPSHYVKEIRYNGIRLPGSTVPVGDAAPARALTILLDDKPGSILGVVNKDGKPLPNANVIAVQPPVNADTMMTSPARGRTDANGRFQISGLRPGEYRVVALSSVGMGTSMQIMIALLNAGEKVEVTASGLKNVTLEAVEAPER